MGNCCCKEAQDSNDSKKAVTYQPDQPAQPVVVPTNPYVHEPGQTPSRAATKTVPNHYVAIYDYETAIDSLPFNKFDEFQIIDFTTNEWFLARKLKDNSEGFVPASYIAEYGSLKTYPWYFEVLSRKDAGVMLNKSIDGSYLVRPSETKPGCFSLSVKVPESAMQTDDPTKKPNSIKHYIIRHSKENNTYFIRQQMPFNSIAELLEFFKNNRDQLGYQLSEPAKPLSSNPDLVIKTWEVDIKDIQLGNELGHGAFGMVYRGTLKGQTQVAIKTFKAGTMDTEAFLEEAELMKKLKHKNILSLLAIQTKAEPIMIVTELMANGALLDYLRKPATKKDLKIKDQIDMAAQCADGMAYLETTGFIHRDLAARNVLVNESRQCKIADFGLSKLDEEYTASNTTRFPVKWTAPEAALYGNYSIKSDVWSFGVLLYEIITFGRVPYPGKNNKEVLDMLETEARMEKPTGCPDPYYGLMMSCHKQDPFDRPTFETLKFQLEDYFFGTTEREYQCNEIAKFSNFYSFFNHPLDKQGHAGVATYVKKTCCPYFVDLHTDNLDSSREGRAIATYHKQKDGNTLVVINVYVPCAYPEEGDKYEKKIRFLEKLKVHVEKLTYENNHVVVTGDLNVKTSIIDSAEAFENRNDPKFLTEWYSARDKVIFKSMLDDSLVDTLRYLHPQKQECYTCWNTQLNGRANNYGTRIDYILVSKPCTGLIKSCSIMSDVTGSDHCPFAAVIDFSCIIPSKTIPPECTIFYPELHGKQTSLSGIFLKRKADLSVHEKSSNISHTQHAKKRKVSGGQIQCTQTRLKFSVKRDTTFQKSQDAFKHIETTKTSSEREGSTSTVSVKSLLTGLPPPPLCSGHHRAASLKTVSKQGPNFGKRFYCCSLPIGPSSSKSSRCNFFKWLEK